MKPIILVPLVAIVLAGVGGGVYLAVSGQDSVEEAVVVQPTATPAPMPAPMPAPTEEALPAATPTPSLQTYRNEKYGYTVTLPEGWRVASFFMERFAERISVVPEDYAVLTPLSRQEEEQAVEQASQEIAIGLAPWYGFARGKSIHIFPMEVIYPGVSIDSFLRDVDAVGVIRANSEVREETLASGKSVIRLTRREVDDNGDFTYDLVIVRTSANDDQGFIIRIVKTPDYDKDAFETIFRSFQDK